MALIVDQQSNLKHFCKICKKGFVCGRALGGHMRAHGIGYESEGLEDDDPACDWEDKSSRGGGDRIPPPPPPPPTNKRMYALRTNPNRLRSCRSCENCGKEFISWKSFLEHGNGKCSSSDDTDSLLSSPTGSDVEGEADGKRSCGWYKRKRSFRTNVGTHNYCHSSEEEDLANCLMMLSNATVEPYEEEKEKRNNSISFITASLMARPPPSPPRQPPPPSSEYKAKGVSSSSNSNPKGSFECKACKKVFNSHQALGGHRASHKKVKGCFAARLDSDTIVDPYHLGGDDENLLASDQEYNMKPSKSSIFQGGNSIIMSSSNNNNNNNNKRKSKVHECSICHRVFSSGQALGGHKRCHWITSNAPDPLTLARFQELQDQIQKVHGNQEMMPMFNNIAQSEKALDLNLPAPKEDMMGIQRDPRNLLSFDVSTEIFLQSWGGVNVEIKHEHEHKQQLRKIENEDLHITEGDNNTNTNTNNNNCESNVNVNVKSNSVDDEADSKIKLAKLCELKDHMDTNDGSSPWLQVGIGSSATLGADP